VRLLTLTSIGLCLSVVACRKYDPQTGEPKEHRLVLKALGPVSQQTYPLASLSLKVIALEASTDGVESEDDLARAVGQPITWRLATGNPGVVLSATTTSTDENGISQITVETGPDDGHIQVGASTPGADPVMFSIGVAPDARQIKLLGPTALTAAIDRTELIRGRVTRPAQNGMPGAPIAGATVTAKLVGGMRNGAELREGDGAYATVSTDDTGMFSLHFVTGTLPDVSYKLELCGAGSCPGTPMENVTILVKRLLDDGGACVYFTDCDEGYVCSEGVCRPAASYCDIDDDCPPGYDCSNATRVCEPHIGAPCSSGTQCPEGEICGAGGHCIPEDGCTSNPDCPDGWTCDLPTGMCVAPPNVPAVDVRGEWTTKYHFDISETLGAFGSNGLGAIIDFLNLAFASNLEINIPVIGNILELIIDELVTEYVKDWMKHVVSMLSDIVHVFENVEADGRMLLLQTPVTPMLGRNITGEETWDTTYIRVRSLCYGTQDSWDNDPSCGRVNVPTTPKVALSYSDNEVEVGVKVKAFNGQIVGDELRLAKRQVDLEFRQFINVVLDMVVTIASKGEFFNFKDFLVDAIPCDDIASFVDGLLCDITGGDICQISGFEYQCRADLQAAVLSFENWLGSAPIALHIVFDQNAIIHDDDSDDEAETFGDPNNPKNNAESSLDGGTDLLTIFGGPLDEKSWWYGVRSSWSN
jgi:DNA-binding ferritin-like protein (Dps family)